ncbi:MAG: hypothetical protein ACFCD0_14670 [Gemmataceae bacterium]
MTADFLNRVDQVYQHCLALPAEKPAFFLKQLHSWAPELDHRSRAKTPTGRTGRTSDGRFQISEAVQECLDCRFGGLFLTCPTGEFQDTIGKATKGRAA